MPIFEYLCDDCGTKFEKLVRRSSESAAVTCPSCGDSHLRQQLSIFAAHSNGSKAAAPQACGGGMCGTPMAESCCLRNPNL